MKKFHISDPPLITLISLSAETNVSDLVCEYKTDPIGIDVEIPRLSWKILSEAYNVKQHAYEIRMAVSPEHLTKSEKLIWSTGKVVSDQSVGVVYDGPRLNSKQPSIGKCVFGIIHKIRLLGVNPALGKWESCNRSCGDWRSPTHLSAVDGSIKLSCPGPGMWMVILSKSV